MRVCMLWLLLPLWFTAASAAPQMDHHQHLLNATMTEPGQQPITATTLIAMLDAAGIKRAVVLSNAYRHGDPRLPADADEYTHVKAENDWTAAEVARYPKRLTMYCSFNPVKNYALAELERCANDRRFGRGIKLQFGSSLVNLDDPAQVSAVKRVFEAANAHRLAIVVHLRVARRFSYGAAQAHVFIDELLAAAPAVNVQVAHLAGGGGGALGAGADEVLAVFEQAFANKDPRVRRLTFDLSGAVGDQTWPAHAPEIARHIRALGVAHVVYGSDGGDPTDPQASAVVAAYRQLPLTKKEFRLIDRN